MIATAMETIRMLARLLAAWPSFRGSSLQATLKVDSISPMETPLPSIDRRPVLRLIEPFARFAQLESSSSIVLLSATLAAIVLGNSRFATAYEFILKVPVGATAGNTAFALSLHDWVNDAFMSIFFLVVGLEVKREFLCGELASIRRAMLPVFAALGGVLTPAFLYLTLNSHGPGSRGWGVPIATDIAFSLAVLTLFGSRVPVGLKIFLVTLAIVDDIAGVLVIAVSYTTQLHPFYLFLVAVLFALCLLLNRLGVVRNSVYFLAGILLWCAFRASGLHATLSGILLALTIPSRTFIPAGRFLDRGRARLMQFERALNSSGPHSQEIREPLQNLSTGIELVQSPLDRMQTTLHPWVSYGIVPVFALTNAGVSMKGFHMDTVLDPVFSGILLGLVVGKPIGITAFSWLAVRLRLAERPEGVSWFQLHAVSWLGGIGFTVSLFISGLAFGAGSEYATARIAVLTASGCAAAIGLLLLTLSHQNQQRNSLKPSGADVLSSAKTGS